MTVRIAFDPSTKPTTQELRSLAAPERWQALVDAATDAGADVVPPSQAEGLMWLGAEEPEALGRLLDANPNIKWVQLPSAGVERYADVLRDDVTFTCAKGSFAGQVAESALMLTLMTLRNVVKQARATSWTPIEPQSLENKRVTVLGGGGIAEEYIRQIAPFNCTVTALRRSADPVAGANRTLTIDHLPEVLPTTDVLMLALALAPDTVGIIGEAELAALPDHGVVVNIARGQHIDTDALVNALQKGSIAAAGLDVTDPEPLPDGHPLWDMDNVMITSHCADSLDYVAEKMAERIAENVRRFANDDDLVGLVDHAHGY